MAKATLKDIKKKIDEETVMPKTEKQRFRLHTAKEAFEELPPVKWTIENFIRAGSVVIFEGRPGSKKTWAFLDLAACFCIGKEWLGFQTRQGTVLIIDEESGNDRLTRRMKQILQGHLFHHDGIKDPQINWTSLDGLDLGNKSDIAELEILIRQINAKLVIIDPLVNVMPGKDENSAKETNPIFQNLRYLADTLEVTVIVVHHLNKNGGTRGTTAIGGAVDLIVQIDSKDKSNTITFTTQKERDIAPTEFYAQASFTDDQVYLTARDATEKLIRFKDGEIHVLKYLFKHGKSSRSDIIDAAETTTAKNAFGSLVTDGFIVRKDDGKKGTAAEYALTDKGKKHAKNL